MKKINRLLKEPAMITAGKLKVSLSQAYRIKDAMEDNNFWPSSLGQAQLLYKHYGVYDYGQKQNNDTGH
jgi:hypothetical protein